MASRLASLLPKLISEEQGAFQKGKVIFSNISLASKLANVIPIKSRGGSMRIKIDIQKAYDSLEWEFLFDVLENFCFADKWIHWVRQILISANIFVHVNGGSYGFFKAERGLHHGDPLAPLLFIIAKEVLCRVIRHIKNMKSFLVYYQKYSGQLMYQGKIEIFFGRIPGTRKNEVFRILKFTECCLLTKYLGINIFKGRFKKEHILEMVDKFKARISSRKVWDLVTDNEHWIIGDGSKINFWKDKWMGEITRAEASALNATVFRNFNARPRHIVFGWRLMQLKLPTDDSFTSKGIPLASQCLLCFKMVLEDIWHTGVAECFKFVGSISVAEQQGRTTTFSTNLEKWIYTYAIPHLGERNSRRFNIQKRISLVVITSIKKDIMEAARGMKNLSPKIPLDLQILSTFDIPEGRSRPKTPVAIIWSKPVEGWFKLNVDGCALGNPNHSGAGGVFRNSMGISSWTFSSYLSNTTNFFAEFSALFQGIEIAKEKGVERFLIECDSIVVIEAIKGRKIPWKFSQKLLILRTYLDDILWKITHIFREGNNVADLLAKKATYSRLTNFWDYPSNYARTEITWDLIEYKRF
ncbi:uncharacterized protein LOC105420038 [Amborella trichopoda]|uniref:uncharacterized protein LOC105420038 n=1 Tax=Amborella trichopoda TaxID=13333 RepID=UPI0005D2E65A|nr:uncharacterized protein LOC105420038 [Amborella trichopoda]|eukprot:XP_011620451.1 uncharacterized protein LOC105420038 [Amborella trichopoda]